MIALRQMARVATWRIIATVQQHIFRPFSVMDEPRDVRCITVPGFAPFPGGVDASIPTGRNATCPFPASIIVNDDLFPEAFFERACKPARPATHSILSNSLRAQRMSNASPTPIIRMITENQSIQTALPKPATQRWRTCLQLWLETNNALPVP